MPLILITARTLPATKDEPPEGNKRAEIKAESAMNVEPSERRMTSWLSVAEKSAELNRAESVNCSSAGGTSDPALMLPNPTRTGGPPLLSVSAAEVNINDVNAGKSEGSAKPPIVTL